MWYVGIRSEVRTAPFVKAALGRGPTIVVPYCDGDALGLWRLERFDELEPGTWGILEPPRRRWRDPDRRVPAEAVDFVVVPGVAFDEDGARLGNGKGYYDRLLPRLRPDCLGAGVAYESQLAPAVPMGPDDVFLDRVVTERAVYRGRGWG